jgi:hypothetical protein
MADRTPTTREGVRADAGEFLAVYPRIGGGDPEGDPPEKPDPKPAEKPDEKPTTTPSATPGRRRSTPSAPRARPPRRPPATRWRGKAKEYEDAQKSETDKLSDRATAAEERALSAERKLAAIEAGLPVSMADRLRGGTPEELKADADALKAALAENKPEGGATPPAGSLDGGARPAQKKKSLDEQIAEAESKQDWAAVSALNAQKLAVLAGHAK